MKLTIQIESRQMTHTSTIPPTNDSQVNQMTENTELKQVKEALECAGEICDNLKRQIYDMEYGCEKIEAIEEGIESLNKYQERLKSEELVEEVEKGIHDMLEPLSEFGETFEFFAWRKDVAQAAISTIIGDKT